MKEFMMIFRNKKNEGGEIPSAEQMQAVMKQWQQWIKNIAAQGIYGGTNRLLSEGKTLKPGNIITDGPFIEAKEIVGGYLVIKADNLDEAVEIAKGCPNLLFGGDVEVRSVMTINDDPSSADFLQAKD
jgi:hypothetical protein